MKGESLGLRCCKRSDGGTTGRRAARAADASAAPSFSRASLSPPRSLSIHTRAPKTEASPRHQQRALSLSLPQGCGAIHRRERERSGKNTAHVAVSKPLSLPPRNGRFQRRRRRRGAPPLPRGGQGTQRRRGARGHRGVRAAGPSRAAAAATARAAWLRPSTALSRAAARPLYRPRTASSAETLSACCSSREQTQPRSSGRAPTTPWLCASRTDRWRACACC